MIDFESKTNRLAAVLVCLGVLGAAALAPASAQDVLQPETQNGIAFVSGGVGDGSLDEIQSVKHQYNLHLLFAIQGSGQYLADVNVTIKDAQGNIVIAAVSDGPFFLVKLPPGKYRISAEVDGNSLTKTFGLTAGRSLGLSFYWPAGS
jgi:hypothetical protein